MTMETQIYDGRAPSYGSEGTAGVDRIRTTRYGDQDVQILSATKDGLAREGRYYVVTNPTISTTVAFGVSASFSDTAPMFVLNNTEPVNGGRSITLDYLRIIPTVAPASGTSMRVLVATDSVLRAPSAGQGVALTPQNTNQAYANDLNALIFSGTGGALLTVPANVNRRILSNAQARSAIPVVLDEIIIAFGQELMASGAPTTASQAGTNVGPVVIPPQTSVCLHIWFPSNSITGLSAEFEMGMWAR